MAQVLPFQALMYDFQKAGHPGVICCPPYDIIPDASVWREKSPYNMIRLEKPEGNDPYTDAARTLEDWKNSKILIKAPAPAYYLYEISYTDNGSRKSVSGLFALTKLTDYAEREVLPHENTLSKAKADRYELMMAAKCHFSPIYCLYDDPRHTVLTVTGRYKAAEPFVEFTAEDGTDHRLWPVDDPADIGDITESFRGRPLYIADGHHRYETSLKVARELGQSASPYVLTMLTDMSHPGLTVYPTHRLLRGLEDFSTEKTLAALRGAFDVEEADTLVRNAVVLLTPEKAYRLTLKDQDFNGLDVTLLHDYILQPVFGIDGANMAAGQNLAYTRDEAEARQAVQTGAAQCAFLINPTRVAQIKAVADAGGKMPQKSTYFYPKLITGLVMHEFGLE